jgi:hypothetical protein
VGRGEGMDKRADGRLGGGPGRMARDHGDRVRARRWGLAIGPASSAAGTGARRGDGALACTSAVVSIWSAR